MDKILYINPSKSEVIGRCGGDEKTEWPRRTDKSRTLKKQEKMNKALTLQTWIVREESSLCNSSQYTDRIYLTAPLVNNPSSNSNGNIVI